MRKYWLTRDGNPGLILFMLGCAEDHHAVEHLAPEGYDMLCVYDYRTLEPFAAEEFSAYRNVTLFAWSFGVWAAERTCRDVASDCAVALGGTPYPVDDRFGIPRRAFLATLRGLRGSGAETFNRRAYGADYDRLAPFFDERPFEDKLDELGVLFERSAEPYMPSLDWTAAVVGDRDAIFPPANMLAYWKEKAVVKPLPHYPFGDPGIVSGYLKKIENDNR